MTCLQTPAITPDAAPGTVASIECGDLAHTLSRFGVSPTDGGWELVVWPDATVALLLWEACPLATMEDAARGNRGDVMIWDDSRDGWRPMTDTMLLHDRYPVRIKVDMLIRQDWED